MTHKGTAVITGAGTAIGTAFAHRLTQRGYDLILIAVDRPQLMTLAAALTDSSGRSVEVLNADLAVSAEVVRIEALLSQDASITLLINHHDITEENEIGATIALGITAPVRLSYALATGFVKRAPERLSIWCPCSRRVPVLPLSRRIALFALAIPRAKAAFQ